MDCIPMLICTQCFACVTVQATVNTTNWMVFLKLPSHFFFAHFLSSEAHCMSI